MSLAPESLRSVVDRQPSHSQPAAVDHDQAPAREILGASGEGPEEQYELPAWAARGPPSEEDERRACGMEAEIPDVRGVVPGITQTFCQARREGVVDEELQGAGRNGRSRCRRLSAA